MAEFIEVTLAYNHKKAIANVNDISLGITEERTAINQQRVPEGTKAVLILRSAEGNEITVEESYDSIKETLRKHGVNVLTVIPVDGPQQVLVPRAWLEAIKPVLSACCAANDRCDDCPLGIDGVCLQKELPRLIRGETHA